MASYGLIMPKVFPTGVFIESIKQTQTSTESGGKNIITASLTNHTKQTFEILNGAKGEKGDTGKAANIKEISATVDNTIGSPQVTVSELGTGSDKTVSFAFSGLKGEKGERGDVFINEEVKAYITEQLQNLPTMPLNPVACYDFADVQYKTIFTHGRIESTGKHGFGPPVDLTPYKGKTIKATVSGYRKGVGGCPKLYIFDTNWRWSIHTGNVLDSETEKTTTLTVTLPTQYEKLKALWHHIPGNNTSNTVITTRTIIETLSDTAIDVSSSGNHSTINGAVSKAKDDTIGTFLQFEQGFLSRKPLDCIGVGKKWSHSRWIKIDPNAQDTTKNFRLWAYHSYDYLILDCLANGGTFKNFTFITYKDNTNRLTFSFPAEKFLTNTWHHLVVMTDLQENYCKKIVYLDNIKIAEKIAHKDFSNFIPPAWSSQGAHYDMLQNLPDTAVKGSLSNLIFFDRLLTEKEVSWLYHNPQYPVKHYTNADEKLLTLLKNGYIQWNGMQLPDTIFSQTGYRWSKIHTYDTHSVWKLEEI